MPILRNAKKALRVSKKKTELNRVIKSQVKTAVTKAKKASSDATLSKAFSAIDKAVKKNILHRNKAGRMKSQLSKLVVTK